MGNQSKFVHEEHKFVFWVHGFVRENLTVCVSNLFFLYMDLLSVCFKHKFVFKTVNPCTNPCSQNSKSVYSFSTNLWSQNSKSVYLNRLKHHKYIYLIKKKKVNKFVFFCNKFVFFCSKFVFSGSKFVFSIW